MAYQKYTNETGSFQELARSTDVKFGQLSLLTIYPKCSRGGHYHTHKTEWFCCIRGRCHIYLYSPKGKWLGGLVLEDSNKLFFKVLPNEVHTIRNHSNQNCELLVISSEEYDPEHPDTIKMVTEAAATKELACSL